MNNLNNILSDELFILYQSFIKKNDDIQSGEIYVLTNYEHSHFYVGFSKDFENRLKNHKKFSNMFVNKFKILNIKARYPIPKNLSSYQAELIIYLIYKLTYGTDNVRGAHISTLNISDDNKIIKNLTNHFNNKCFKCNKSGHYAKNCTRR